MNTYEVWCDLAPGIGDLEFVASLRAYLDPLVAEGRMVRYRIRRRKLGFGPEGIGEWNVSMDFKGLAQLDEAFVRVSRRDAEIENLHAAVFSKVVNFRSGLYREFPDPHREGA